MENKVGFWRNQFYQFLVEEGALFNYLKYVSFDSYLFERKSAGQFMSLAQMTVDMSWSRSDEGTRYWNRLYNKWLDKIKEIKNENRTKMGRIEQ